jgi:hypothetical protein
MIRQLTDEEVMGIFGRKFYFFKFLRVCTYSKKKPYSEEHIRPVPLKYYEISNEVVRKYARRRAYRKARREEKATMRCVYTAYYYCCTYQAYTRTVNANMANN